MSADTAGFGPFCGTMGCRDPADVVIRHPKHGERTVCDEHAGGHEVIRRV